jgi:predicted transcriptional regulator
MSDLLNRIRNEIDTRLDDLRPRVAEYESLESAKHALSVSQRGVKKDAGVKASSPSSRRVRPRRRPQNTQRATRKPRAKPGERERQIVPLLRENPDITASNIALLIDASPATVHVTINRLKKQGKVDRRNGKWIVRKRGPRKSSGP